jgi:hypothetical protein
MFDTGLTAILDTFAFANKIISEQGDRPQFEVTATGVQFFHYSLFLVKYIKQGV